MGDHSFRIKLVPVRAGPEGRIAELALGLDISEMVPIFSNRYGPALDAATGALTLFSPHVMATGEDAEVPAEAAKLLVSFTVWSVAMSMLAGRIIRRLRERQTPLLVSEDAEDIVASIQDLMGQASIDPVEIALAEATARGEIEDALRLVDKENQAWAAVLIAKAVSKVAKSAGTLENEVIEDDDLRAEVYAEIFGPNGLGVWMYKAALIAARMSGLQTTILERVFRAHWASGVDAVRAAVRSALPRVEDDQLDLVVDVQQHFAGNLPCDGWRGQGLHWV
jgi:hypothetical protein